jgi:hypothetical protein
MTPLFHHNYFAMGKKCEAEVRRFILYSRLLKRELKEMKKGGTSGSA